MAVAPTRTDAALVRRLQARERTAWEELYGEYQPRLRAFAYRLAGNAHDADDLVQETFVRALPALDRLDPDTVDLAAYLFATTRNLFLKQVERGKRAQPTAEVPEPDLPPAIEDDPERSALLQRQQEEVRLANARLDPRQRLVLALCELEDRSYADIGELVGLNENAVAQLVFRARERLRTELRLVQVDPESFPEECRAFLPALAQHLDGKLRGPKLEATLAHLEGCERCQSALADMREARRRYRALLLPPIGVSGEQARAAIDDELERAGYWHGPRRLSPFRRPRGTAAAVAATGAVALLVGGGLGAATLLSRTTADDASPAATSLGSSGPGPTSVATSGRPAGAGPTTTAGATSAPPGPKPAKTAPQTSKPGQAAAQATTTAETTAQVSRAHAPTSSAAPAVVSPADSTASGPPRRPPPARPKTTTRPTPATPAPDTDPPSVTFSTGPPETTSQTEATFAFGATEAGASLACRLDAGAWEACSSPRALAGVPLGAHTFEVRATDRAGNVGGAAARRWTVTPPPDTTAPTVAFGEQPPASSTSRTARFAFSASEPSVTFACSYDGDPFAPCESPHTIEDAGVDDHSLAVRATDAAGNSGPPAVARWTVVAPLPDLVASLTDTSVIVRNAGDGPAARSVVLVSGVGSFTVPALDPGQSSTRTYACARGTIVATADETRVVTESDETNNRATRAVTCLGLGA